MAVYKPEGSLISTKSNAAYLKTPQTLSEAMALGKILEARAICCDCDHNLILDLGCMKGVIPRAEAAAAAHDGDVRDIAIISRVNKPTCFKILCFAKRRDGTDYAILSRRAVQEECRREYIDRLTPGDIVPVSITRLEPFGCFVDIACGIISMIPIDFISVSRISHPSDRFVNGQNIYAVVKSIDEWCKITGDDYETPQLRQVRNDADGRLVDVLIPLVPARAKDEADYRAEMESIGFCVEKFVPMAASSAIVQAASIYVRKPDGK